MSERDKTPIYAERGMLVAYVTGDADSFRITDAREPMPTEQEMMISRLNAGLRIEGGADE